MKKILFSSIQGGYFIVLSPEQELVQIVKQMSTLGQIESFDLITDLSFCLPYHGENIQCYSLHQYSKQFIENDLSSITADDIEYYALSWEKRESLAKHGMYESFKFINNLGAMDNVREKATNKIMLEFVDNQLKIKASFLDGTLIESDAFSIEYLTLN